MLLKLDAGYNMNAMAKGKVGSKTDVPVLSRSRLRQDSFRVQMRSSPKWRAKQSLTWPQANVPESRKCVHAAGKKLYLWLI